MKGNRHGKICSDIAYVRQYSSQKCVWIQALASYSIRYGDESIDKDCGHQPCQVSSWSDVFLAKEVLSWNSPRERHCLAKETVDGYIWRRLVRPDL